MEMIKGKNYTVADIQGFEGPNEKFIIRELAFSTQANVCWNFHIKQPYSFQKLPQYCKKQAKWLTKHHHGLMWSTENGVSMNRVVKFFIEQHKEHIHNIFIVKGLEKKKCFENILITNNISNYVIHDADDFGIPSIKRIYQQYSNLEQCAIHTQYNYDSYKICALTNVNLLRNIFN